MQEYLSGTKLYGDHLSLSEIERWFADEAEAYHALTQSYENGYSYAYDAFNIEHGFRHLPHRLFRRVLGIGSAYGYEFNPIQTQCGEITILEPSDGLTNSAYHYIKPAASGLMPFPDNSFDLVVCFSALHHVPTVRTHIREISRVLDADGYALISEPIISMGDWRYPRAGLTKHERGIPLSLFRQMIDEAQLTILREHLTGFAHMPYLARVCDEPYNRRWAVKLDSLLCSLPFWSNRYHATSLLQKLRASSVFYVLASRKSIASGIRP